ncbi:hypothetical protein MMC13_005618 [Lambiella insularis]|nr:hypothetical protein [Lambiella insularis]
MSKSEDAYKKIRSSIIRYRPQNLESLPLPLELSSQSSQPGNLLRLSKNGPRNLGERKERRAEEESKPWGWMSRPDQLPSLKRPEDVKAPSVEQVPKSLRKKKVVNKVSGRVPLTDEDKESMQKPSSERVTEVKEVPQNVVDAEPMPKFRQIQKKRKAVGGRSSDPKGRIRTDSASGGIRETKDNRGPKVKHRKDLSTTVEEVPQLSADKGQSLLEQLFPEEAKKPQEIVIALRGQYELPRLPPPDIDALYDSFDDNQTQGQPSSRVKTREATFNAFRQENTTALILSRVSTSLSEADFRRIIPRGTHIEEWRGPGDILKIIPVRHHSSLSPTSSYYLLFTNPSYARAYQNQVIQLHRLAQIHTPTSLESPIPPTPGVLDSEGHDVYAMLQDFTLSPPSVRLHLRIVFQPFTAALRLVSEHHGYPQLVDGNDKAGRAVLCWVDGYQPSKFALRDMLSKDGNNRGLQWGPLRGEGDIEVLNVDADAEGGDGEKSEEAAGDHRSGQSRGKIPLARDVELKPKRHGRQRFLISFEDENEARRFVRLWHRRPYPFPLQDEAPTYGEPEPLVHAEYAW